MRRLDLSELEIRIGDQRVAVRRPDPGAATAASRGCARSRSVARPATDRDARHLAPGRNLLRLAAPRRRAVSCESAHQVSAGDPIGLVEAMKVFNEITTDHTGEVVAVLVENGDTIAAGQSLIIVDTGTGS